MVSSPVKELNHRTLVIVGCKFSTNVPYLRLFSKFSLTRLSYKSLRGNTLSLVGITQSVKEPKSLALLAECPT